ncbi:telomerase Cajal body protein 1 isoform X1 [Cajanus cajan]|uniref:Telomerase Cajal body protein 1 n=1 Tax=Cajanus cajan TaxID=3821 RepID=A0A151S8R1_CAJCA|nr:telomerase Cajal body protein 1 isoform X1 [Cajanus cajan]XP_029129948.1 telomerase Cajal body protein 1 isoform X1 [Cajanus cajan]XP_029129949.1 telomerase Cajal body protein 1 isoform X1 [Cajanus cajan]KYP51206.1 Telomerase Cajal body protein 1 [Cajanus cajan]
MGEEKVEEALQSESNANEEYSFPALRFDVPPHRTYHFHRQFISPTNPNSFLKAVKWSPDGSSFLTSSDDNTLRLFTPPSSETAAPVSASHDDDSFAANVVMHEGESIHDFCWYPYMSSSDLVTNVFATTTRDHPIHLWDATSGQLRCTYRAYDAMDEITAAFSIAFNPAGNKIFAGYNKCIRMFDLHRPGRDFELFSTVKDKKEGLTGIISAMAFSPFHSGMLALGSYNQTTAIYREDNMELLYVLHGQEGGITHVQFSRDGNYLYTGGRKDPYILCWDVRKSVDCVYKLYRSSANTNQRILFDIDPSGQHLGTGGQDGLVHIYNLQTGQWVSSFEAALDTVNGFSFHPFLPHAVSSSGHRRFVIPDDDNKELCLSGNENCVSVWSFCYDSTMETDLKNNGSFNNQSESDYLD